MTLYRNSRRSKRLIREAFAELVDEKGDINKITVKEIIDKADISKSTFYAHYVDIYAVIEEFENEIISTISNSVDDFLKDKNNEEFMPYINRLLELFTENEELYKKLFKVENEVNFVDKIKTMILKKLENSLKVELRLFPKEKFKFYLDFITNGITYLVVDYFKSTVELSLTFIADEMNNMLKMLVTFLKAEEAKFNN
jgi:AcrR family transcriptional regulator